MTFTLNHLLHPTATQVHALEQRFDAAEAAWRLLAIHARSEAAGAPVSMQEAAQPSHRSEAWPGGHGRVPQRSVAAWRALFGPVADDLGWTGLLGRHALDALVALFRRRLRDLESEVPLTSIPNRLPAHFRMLSLVRPSSSLSAEVMGVGTVLAPVFSLPVPAAQAVDVWRQQFGTMVRDTREALTGGLLTGDEQADRDYLRHVAQYGPLGDRLATPLVTRGEGPVQLTFLEETELERTGLAGEHRYRIHWRFRVKELRPPRDSGLIAIDPGIRTVYAWATRYGVGRFDSPLTRPWSAPPPAPRISQVNRVLDVDLAQLSRQELLHCRQVRPMLEAATSLFLDYRCLALEATDLAGMQRRGLDYPEFVAYTGLDLHMQFLRAVARHSDGNRQALDIEPAGTTMDCAACGKARSMTYRGRSGRCAACGQCRHRDENGALNLYARAARQLGWAA